jgi:hypothetical protein
VRPRYTDEAPPPPPSTEAEASASQSSAAAEPSQADPAAAAASPQLPLPGTVALLSPGGLETLAQKAKYQKRFHVVYFDCHSGHLLTPATRELLAPGARVLLETARYVVELKAEQRTLFVDKLKEKAVAAGLRQVGPDTADILEFELPASSD